MSDGLDWKVGDTGWWIVDRWNEDGTRDNEGTGAQLLRITAIDGEEAEVEGVDPRDGKKFYCKWPLRYLVRTEAELGFTVRGGNGWAKSKVLASVECN